MTTINRRIACCTASALVAVGVAVGGPMAMTAVGHAGHAVSAQTTVADLRDLPAPAHDAGSGDNPDAGSDGQFGHLPFNPSAPGNITPGAPGRD